MARVQITLYSEDAEQFEDYREAIGERRDGNQPAKAELLRLMMEQFDPGLPTTSIRRDRQ